MNFATLKTMMFDRPDLLERILEVNIQSVAAYLTEQVKAGAQALMIFDTWGGMLPDGWYQQVSLAAMQKGNCPVAQRARRSTHPGHHFHQRWRPVD
jgi:uroporphyrinogen decarboxylase